MIASGTQKVECAPLIPFRFGLGISLLWVRLTECLARQILSHGNRIHQNRRRAPAQSQEPVALHPRGKLVVITGLSGSGKSSLAFDTIYAEGQRKYVESLSAYARQFLDQMKSRTWILSRAFPQPSPSSSASPAPTRAPSSPPPPRFTIISASCLQCRPALLPGQRPAHHPPNHHRHC